MNSRRYAPRARADLDEIWTFVARQGGIAAADRLLDRIETAINALAGMPEAGLDRSEVSPGLRSFPAGNYLIYYRVRARVGIVILRVLHAKRDQFPAFSN